MLLSHPPKLIQSIYPSLVWKINTNERNLYLTFDDGPTPGVTDVILDLLKKAEAKATFFCLGKNVLEHPELFQRILDEGHVVGNHTCNHLNGWKHTSVDFLNDARKFEEIYKAKLFRPPYGRIKSAQIKSLIPDYKIIMWSILSRDYDPVISKEKCFALSTKNWRKGSIIVFHDSAKAKGNVLYVVEKLLEKAKLEGWNCESINYNTLSN